MNSTHATLNIESIEEYTLFALDRSQEGLCALQEDCRHCAEALISRSPDALSRLSTLACNLRDFDVFQKDILSFFEIDPAGIQDTRGHLLAAEGDFRRLLDEFAVSLEAQDFQRIASVLNTDLPAVLHRFAELFPVLRDYIDVQYLGTTP